MTILRQKKYNKKEQEQFESYVAILSAGKEAGCPLDQMENFTKASVALQPHQLHFCSYARQCDLTDGPTAIMFGGGRGAAKTHGVWAQVFCDDCQRFPGLKVLILRKVGKANKEQINDYRSKLLHVLPHNYRQQDGEILFPNGSKVILGNFKDEKDIDKYLGQEYDLIAISESNQLTFSKKKFILTCLRTSKSGWRPRCYEDTNPGGIGMAENKKIYYDPFKNKAEKETRYVHCTVYDNRFVNAEYVTQLETLVGWQRKAWLDGSWEFAAGSYFTNFIEDYHVYPNSKADFKNADFRRWWLSYDYGFSHNAAAILFGQTKDGFTCAVDEYCESEEVIWEQAENIKSMVKGYGIEIEDLDYIVAGKDCFDRSADSEKEGQGKTFAEAFSLCGLTMSQAYDDRQNGFKQCHSLFGDISRNVPAKGFISAKCVNLIDQIKKAQHSIKRSGDVEKFNADEEGNGGDDCLDAWRKGVASDPSTCITWAKPLQVSGFQPAMLRLGQ